MNRRAFFARLGGAFVAALASPDLAALLPDAAGSFGAPPLYPRTFVITTVVELAVPPLALHSDAFAIAMRPFKSGWSKPESVTIRKGDIVTISGWGRRIHEGPPTWESSPRPRGSFAAYVEADRQIQECV